MTIWTLAVWQRIYAIYVSKQSSKSIVNQHVVSHLSTYHKINPNSHKSLHPFKTASCFFSTKKDTLRIYKNNPQNSNQQIRPYVHLLRAKPTGETALHFFSGWKMICFFSPKKHGMDLYLYNLDPQQNLIKKYDPAKKRLPNML